MPNINARDPDQQILTAKYLIKQLLISHWSYIIWHADMLSYFLKIKVLDKSYKEYIVAKTYFSIKTSLEL